MKKLASLVIAGLLVSTSAFATKYTLSNGNFGSQTSAISFADGDIIEIPASNNVSFTTTQTINKAVIVDIHGELKMTPGNKILTLATGSLVNIYDGGELSGASAARQLIIGTNNVFNGASTISSTGATLTASSTSFGFASMATPLPIKLLSFEVSARATRVKLNWSAVADADEVSIFVIEQSTDGKNWAELATEVSRGGVHETVNYSLELEVPKGVTSAIYRIRYQAEDGQSSYSAARSVSFSSDMAASVSVTSAGTSIRVNVNGTEAAGANVYVTTMDGKMIYSQSVAAGVTDALSIPTTASGMYIVTVTDNKRFRIASKIVL